MLRILLDPGFFADPDPGFKSPDPLIFFYFNSSFRTFFSRIRIFSDRIRIFGRSGLRKKG